MYPVVERCEGCGALVTWVPPCRPAARGKIVDAAAGPGTVSETARRAPHRCRARCEVCRGTGRVVERSWNLATRERTCRIRPCWRCRAAVARGASAR